MSALQAIVIAILQGATELFPVSSLGHAVVLPALLHWPLDQRSPEFLPFLVMLHLGTATALLVYFWRDWWSLATGVLGLASPHQVTESRRVFALIVVATIPAVIVGFLLEKFVRGLFGAPLVAAVFLMVNAVLLLAGEKLRGRSHRPLSGLTMMDALTIGCWQCTALIPGISRSGATIVGGLLRGIDHEGSAYVTDTSDAACCTPLTRQRPSTPIVPKTSPASSRPSPIPRVSGLCRSSPRPRAKRRVCAT